ncbi:hypothetical protein D3C72_1671320 [compost metagenome]
MVVDRIRNRPAIIPRESGQLSGQLQQMTINPLGVQDLVIAQMGDLRLPAIDDVQHHEVAHFGNATAPGLQHPHGQCLSPLLQQACDVIHHGVQ